MSDTQPAAEAVKNPAESVVDAATADANTEVSAEAPKSEEAANGDATDIKNEDSPKRKGNYKRDNENGGRYKKDYHHKSDRNDRGRNFGRSNNKKRSTEFDDLPESDDPVEIRNQVEFYFSDINLGQDEHLFLEVGGPKNHPVSLKHVHSFKRMRRFQPYSAVVAALRDSETLIVLDDGKYSGTSNEAVQRKEPLICPSRPQDDERPPTMEQLFHRTKKATQNRLENSAYAKGFVEEGQDVGQIVLEQFFKPYGAIMVRKRRDEDDNWKGSVFVEFDTQDNMEQFVNLDPKPQFQGRDLTIMTKKGYSEMKCNEKGIVPAWKREDRDDGEDGDRSFRQNNGRGRGRGRGRGDGRGRGRGRGGGGRGRGGSDRFGRERDRRHNRSRSADSVDKDDWNKRRELDNNKDQKRKGPELDADGVPVIQDSRKRKTDEGDHDDGVKKPKMEIKEDE